MIGRLIVYETDKEIHELPDDAKNVKGCGTLQQPPEDAVNFEQVEGKFSVSEEENFEDYDMTVNMHPLPPPPMLMSTNGTNNGPPPNIYDDWNRYHPYEYVAITITNTFNPPPALETEKLYKITVDPNGGNWNGNTDKIVKMLTKDATYTLPEAPTKEGYKFLYWKGSKYQPGQKYKVIEDHTFTAVWEPNKPAKVRKIPQTGDSSEIMLYAGLTALMGLSTLLIMRKRKVNN